MTFIKGHKPYNYWSGKNRSQTTKSKIREKLKLLYNSPEKHPQYKGWALRSGYKYLKISNHPNGGKQGYVAEHRLVMEKHLGRNLTRKEVVHHMNGIKTDNRLENLVLCESAGKHIFDHHPEIVSKLSGHH